MTELGHCYPTCSLIFRSKVIEELPEWYVMGGSDEALDLLITEYGTLAYMRENMSAYRIHSGGIWNGKVHIDHVKESLHTAIIFYQHKKFREMAGKILAYRIINSTKSIILNSKDSFSKIV